MSAVLLFKIEIAWFTFDNLLFWFPSDFPVCLLCPQFFRFLKTIDTAILLVGFGLGVLLPAMQTLNDLSRFSGVGFPAISTTESMTQRLGLKHFPAGFAGFRRSVLYIQTFSCPLQFGLIRTLCRAGHSTRNSIEFDPTDDTILGRIFLGTPPTLLPPMITAGLWTGLCLPICLKYRLADHAGFRTDGSVFPFLVFKFVFPTADLSAG